MDNKQNQENKNLKEQSEQELNKAASGEMDRNDAEQNEVYRKNQNVVTRSTDTKNIPDSLSERRHSENTDSLSVEEQNRRKLESEQDADFGNEQLQ